MGVIYSRHGIVTNYSNTLEQKKTDRNSGVTIVDKQGNIGVNIPSDTNTAILIPHCNYQSYQLGKVSYLEKDKVIIGNREYTTVKINNKWWITQNLDYKFNVNGVQIPIGNGLPTNTSNPGAWYYDNREDLYSLDGTYKCGLLYNWYAAKYLDDNKATLLPSGWRVPTITELSNLLTFVGSDAGNRLKLVDNSIDNIWPTNWNGTDRFDFGLVPTGAAYSYFYYFNEKTYIWSSNSNNGSDAKYIGIERNGNVEKDTALKGRAYPIRLIKDIT